MTAWKGNLQGPKLDSSQGLELDPPHLVSVHSWPAAEFVSRGMEEGLGRAQAVRYLCVVSVKLPVAFPLTLLVSFPLLVCYIRQSLM